jgi:tetratricopeptide (TPR) repeat protein
MNSFVIEVFLGGAILVIIAGFFLMLSRFLPLRRTDDELFSDQIVGSPKTPVSKDQKKTALTRRARFAVKQGIFEFAEDLLYQASGLDDKDPNILFQLALSLQEQDKLLKATVIAEKLVKISPKLDYLLLLSLILRQIGEKEKDESYIAKSILCYEAILEKHEDNTDALNGMAKGYIALLDIDEAVDLLEKSFEIDAHQREVGLLLLDMYEDIGNATKQKGHFEKLSTYFPEDNVFLTRKLEFLLQAKEYSAIVEQCRLITDERKNDIAILRPLGLSLYHLKQFDDAITTFTDLCELDSERSSNFYNLSLSQLSQKKYEPSLLSIQKAIDLDANDARFHFLRARILEFLGNTAEVKNALKRVLELDPENFEAKKIMLRLS